MMRLPNEKAQGLVEYALILVLVAVVVIAILLLVGPIIGNTFSTIDRGLGDSPMCGLSARPDMASTTRNTAVTISVLDNDTIIDCSSVVYTTLGFDANNGAVTRNDDDTFTYQPNLDFVGEDEFIYRLCLSS